MHDNADYVQSELWEGVTWSDSPEQKRPTQMWCPSCGLTIIDRIFVRCETCEDALQSEDE